MIHVRLHLSRVKLSQIEINKKLSKSCSDSGKTVSHGTIVNRALTVNFVYNSTICGYSKKIDFLE